MVKTTVAGGLCAACRHDPECALRPDEIGVVLQCEQFEMGFRRVAAAPNPVRAREELYAKARSNGFLGLCVNCDHRDTCIYPKPDGGVWRCEEYR